MTERTTAEVAIIGSGVVGSSIAYHLAKRGCTNVLVLDRTADIRDSSTARSGAGVRHQWSSATNILLSKYSITRLHRFKEEIGVDSGLRLVGYLFLVRKPATWATYQQNVALQHRYGVPTQILTPDQVGQIVPNTRIDDLQGATFCDQDGYCDPMAIRNGYLQRAGELGVRVWNDAPVTAIRIDNERSIIIDTPRGRVHCATVVNAAGGWSGDVAALVSLAIPVQHFRRHLYVLDPPTPLAHDIPFTFDVDSGFYLRSSRGQIWCGKINPAEVSGHTTEVDWEWMPHVLAQGYERFPMLRECTVNRQQSWAGTYEITPDHAPILGRHPELPNYVDASGFSGHGIMHSPATGLLVAEEILDGRAHTINIDEFRITRFQAAHGTLERNVF